MLVLVTVEPAICGGLLSVCDIVLYSRIGENKLAGKASDFSERESGLQY